MENIYCHAYFAVLPYLIYYGGSDCERMREKKDEPTINRESNDDLARCELVDSLFHLIVFDLHPAPTTPQSKDLVYRKTLTLYPFLPVVPYAKQDRCFEAPCKGVIAIANRLPWG